MNKPKLIIDTNLSYAAQNVLKSLGYISVNEILSLSEQDLLEIENIKNEIVKEILNFIEQYKISYDGTETYSDWLQENKLYVEEYIKMNDIFLKTLPISVRVYNALLFNGKTLMSDIALEDESKLANMELMNKTYACEVNFFRREYLNSHKESIIQYVLQRTDELFNEEKIDDSILPTFQEDKVLIDTIMYESSTAKKFNDNDKDIVNIDMVKSFLLDENSKEKIIQYFKITSDTIDDIVLSVRSSNALKKGRVNYLYEVLNFYPEKLFKFRNMGTKSVDEICEALELYILKKWKNIFEYIQTGNVNEGIENNISILNPLNMSVIQLYRLPEYQEQVLNFLEKNDVKVENMGLSTRSLNVFKEAKITKLSDIIKIYPEKISSLPRIGKKSIDDINDRVNYYLNVKQSAIAAYCSGDLNALYSDEFILETIWSCYEKEKFGGMSYKKIREKFPEDFDDDYLKKFIGKLLSKKQLEYVDFRCYRVYPSVLELLNKNLFGDRTTEILKRRMNGSTLEEIGQEFGITRERIRQILKKNFKKLRELLFCHYGVEVFDEDYYLYLYTNYNVPMEVWKNYLNISSVVLNYLSNMYDQGTKNIEEALSDLQIDLNIKFKISDYLNKDKIMIDGKLIQRRRLDIENYVLSKFALTTITYDEFCEKYNMTLYENNIKYDENIYYTDDIRKSRINRIMDSMKCLYKQGERLRYYDIVCRDYTELIDTINLQSFKNIEISTLKFFNNYPELMDKYDIQDQYELHNLLKKVVDVNLYNDLSFGRQPMLCFGKFDRKQAIYDIIVQHAPVTLEKLVDLIYDEYGYSKSTIIYNMLDDFTDFYDRGVYDIELKKIPYERISKIKEALVDDFYYFSEIKEKYLELFENADPEEINYASLRNIGYNVFSNYIIQNHNTAETYFCNLLTMNDVYDITPINKRYSSLSTYYNVYNNLRRDYKIFCFGDNQIVSMKRLNKLGIYKEDIENYCLSVIKFVERDIYFTMHKLREMGFESNLDDLGFDDSFYSGILAVNTNFKSQRIFGTIVLCLNDNFSAKNFNMKDFILKEFSKFESIDMDSFIEQIYEEYGIKITDRYKIIEIISDTDFYYDSIMDKIYRNKKYYYEEFDD